MGTTPSFTPVYRKNNKDVKVKVGISFGGSIHLGINHPSELKVKAKAVIKESTKSTPKKFGFKKPSRK